MSPNECSCLSMTAGCVNRQLTMEQLQIFRLILAKSSNRIRKFLRAFTGDVSEEHKQRLEHRLRKVCNVLLSCNLFS